MVRRRPSGRPRGRPGRSGFSLVELVVALILLQVGLLAVAGMGLLAARAFAEAASLQRGGGALAVVADSLVRHGVSASGERPVPPLLVRWRARPEGLELRLVSPDDDRTLMTTVLVPPPEGP